MRGEIGIRTRDTILSYTRFPGVPLKPLEHLSNDICPETGANIGIIFRIRKNFKLSHGLYGKWSVLLRSGI